MNRVNGLNYLVLRVLFLSLWGLNSIAFAQIQPNRPTFFEDGYRQLDREIQQLERQSSPQDDSLLTVDTGELRWQKMISREGGFTVWIPAGIQTDEVRSVPILDKTLEFEVMSTNQPNSRFIVAYSGVVNSANLGNINQVFEEIMNYIISDTQFKVIGNPSEVQKQYPSYSTILSNETEKIYLQFYLINNRVYVLGVNQKSPSDLSEFSRRFFESFQVL
ncbi:YdcH family protein [Capilliphycus salinus ALCB114379]|uniref:YdcH family protein n=1 Tax=Capilliphycus salinus TaxID=2768948 RepID=UPI0039A5EC7F